MEQNARHTTRLRFGQVLSLGGVLLLLLLIPLVLSNNPATALLAAVVMLTILFVPGYLLGTLLSQPLSPTPVAVSTVAGLACVTTTYDIFLRASVGAYFPYVVLLLSAVAIILFIQRTRLASASS